MKPITFEVIRNLLKTKKKGKEKGIDQSFKRSDSFKRISIRKSYLDRGRRRGVLRSKTVLDLNDIEIKSTSSSLERRNKSRDGSPDECSSQEPSIIAELERKDASIDEKIRALQEINDRYMRENQKSKYPEKKTAIPKPPRNSKLKERNNTKQIEVVRTENVAKPITLETSKENICDNSSSKEHKSSKTVSQINILFTGETNGNSLNKPHSDKRNSKLLEDDQSSYYSVSTFTLDSQYQNTSSTRHSDYSRSISYPQGVDIAKDQDNPSFLTFTTYCQSTKSNTNEAKKNYVHKNKYLETSFDEPDPGTNTSRSNTDSGSKLVKNVKNISTTSLVYEPTYVKPVINTQTFKMVKSKSREGVIIRIPAVENATRSNNEEIDNDKDRLNRQSSNDSAVEADSNSSVEKLNQIQEKSTINATITYEKICKAFERQEAKYKKNPKKDKRKDLRRERLESHLNTQRPVVSPSKDKQDMVSDEGLIASTESLEISSPRNGTFELKSPRNSTLDLPSISYTGTYDKATSDKFTFPKDYFEEENNISYRVGNDAESPDGIAIPLKIKENPFTKHKEISAVNTSRIWKQVNLGQEEEMSIISTNPLPIPPPLKPKNESFKSMSSHDSGFSLTLTKPKNLFRRKSKKQRRKPKLSVSRDGYFKRVMVVQHNSTKRKKNNKKQRPQGKDVFKALYDDNWTKLSGNYTSADQILSGNEYENQSILRDFENFCNRNKHFNKEINDLEEFYEEHLKRLKHYYLQRKQMNEVAIREFYRDYANDEEFYDAHIVSRNDTFRFKSKRVGRESPEYLFPYPDKRVALGKKRSKMQFPEVRTFKSHILGTQYSDNITNSKNESLENLRSNKDFHQFPYWKLSRKVSKRERVAPRFKDRFVDPFETEKNEVSLADIFPSVNDTTPETNIKNNCESDSDEFSEQEFIANCLGDDLYCSTCDKNNSDCECYTDDEANNEANKSLAKNSNSKMKSLKRRRSKKRLRKNHSTLRRDYFYGKQFILSFIHKLTNKF